VIAQDVEITSAEARAPVFEKAGVMGGSKVCRRVCMVANKDGRFDVRTGRSAQRSEAVASQAAAG
jgi:hypothetical protein